jgi:outer membrane protein assembly factor BamB
VKLIQFLFIVGFASCSAWAQDISYFRQDHGVASGQFFLPDDFSKNARLVWRAPMLPGHSTPCVLGDSIFLTTFDNQNQQLSTVCLARKSGEVRWQQAAETKAIEPVHATGSPATPTPASNGKQVFVFFGSCGMLCYDWDGNLIWHHAMGPFQDEFGAASSPILAEDLVILNQDHDVGSFLMAMDQRTGETVWKVSRDEATRSYSTPVIFDRDGTRQILVAGALQLTAYDLRTGDKLWWYDGLSRLVDVTPVVHEGLVYLATWSPGGDAEDRIGMEPFSEALKSLDGNADGFIGKDELPAGSAVAERFFRIDLNQDGLLDEQEWRKHALVFDRAKNVAVALEPSGRGALPENYVRWTYTRGLPVVPSSVVYDGTMTMVKDSGIITILDATTGQLLKQMRAQGRGNYYASLVAGDGKVYAASESGVVTVLSSGSEGRVLSSHDFGERIMATPVIKDGEIYIRTEQAVYCYRRD